MRRMFSMLVIIVLVITVLNSCMVRINMPSGAAGSDPASLKGAESSKKAESEYFLSVDENGEHIAMDYYAYMSSSFPYMLPDGNVIRYDFSYRELRELFGCMKDVRIGGYGFEGNFPQIYAVLSGNNEGLVIVFSVSFKTNKNNEFCPEYLRILPIETFGGTLENCSEETKNYARTTFENLSGMKATQTYEEASAISRKAPTYEEDMAQKGSENVSEEKKSAEVIDKIPSETDVYSLHKTQVPYQIQVASCKTYLEYEDKLKNGEISEPEYFALCSPYMVNFRNEMANAVVLADGTVISTNTTFEEIEKLLKSMGNIRGIYIGGGMCDLMIFELNGENEGFAIEFACPGYPDETGKLCPEFVCKFPIKYVEKNIGGNTDEKTELAWKAMKNLTTLREK